MTHSMSSRSTQDSTPARFPVSEFEPLLEEIEAAAPLRMHPKLLQEEGPQRRDQSYPLGQMLALPCFKFE